MALKQLNIYTFKSENSIPCYLEDGEKINAYFIKQYNINKVADSLIHLKLQPVSVNDVEDAVKLIY